MKLREGDDVPALNIGSVRGKKVRLPNPSSDYTLVVFLRFAGCPLCSLAIHRLTLESGLLAKNGCEVVAFVNSTASDIETHIYGHMQREPTFPIVADKKQHYFKQFGVMPTMAAVPFLIRTLPAWLHSAFELGYKQTTLDGDVLIVPAMFLIDKRGVIKHTNYGVNFGKDATFTPVYEALTFGAYV
ncbi:MAG TPA: redoxin domain-containing protein [Candidatus Saccharimonadales bacterium]|jgi:peroxiredoxin